MLYGKRPFGEGKSQERVLSEGIMLNATQVEFPSEIGKISQSTASASSATPQVPKVTDEAKDFIRTCLTWDQRLRSLLSIFFPSSFPCRPDVLSLCQHPYIRGVPKKGKTTANDA